MSFFKEPQAYEKTVLSDLQGAWSVLRSAVVANGEASKIDHEEWNRMMFHIEEAMSWETVRHLARMKPLVVLIRNIALKSKLDEDVMIAIEDVQDTLDEVLTSHKTDKL